MNARWLIKFIGAMTMMFALPIIIIFVLLVQGEWVAAYIITAAVAWLVFEIFHGIAPVHAEDYQEKTEKIDA